MVYKNSSVYVYFHVKLGVVGNGEDQIKVTNIVHSKSLVDNILLLHIMYIHKTDIYNSVYMQLII